MRTISTFALFTSILISVNGTAVAQEVRNRCVIRALAELPVTLSPMGPLIKGQINGMQATFIADSGGFYSLITKDTAKASKLTIRSLPYGAGIIGAGGPLEARRATVKSFSLAGGLNDIRDIEFIVAESKLKDGVAGLIGQNILGRGDTEYDLANGVIRLHKSENCENRSLAYWAREQLVAVMDMDSRVKSDHFLAVAHLNGKRIRVLFDSGAMRSVVTRSAALRLGVAPGIEGVVAAGLGRGVGVGTFATWLARFDVLDLGGEQIKNPRLRIGATQFGGATDMLLGLDFFRSHRIYISRTQQKIYITYNGGPVFDLSIGDEPDSSTIGANNAMQKATRPPNNAAEFRQSAKELVSRFELDAAIKDLSAAIALEPNNAENFRLRAQVRVDAGESAAAQQDYERALNLDVTHADTFLQRGWLRLLAKNTPAAESDFNRYIDLSRKANDATYKVAMLFASIEDYAGAIKYLDYWMEKFPKYRDREVVLNQRCWMRAMNRTELDLALNDCNSALRLRYISSFYDSRGMVLLQLGRYEEAIRDYEQSLKISPFKSWSHYGLGIARLRTGDTEAGKKSIETSIALDPSVSEEFARLGIEP